MIAALESFPCRDDKRPLTQQGFYDASLGIEWNSPLVGVPTGAVNGFDVLDVDLQGLTWLASQAIPLTRTHETRSGGKHLLFKHAEGLRNSAGRIAPG